ncbi:uncharacterized protein N0V89_003796 [Didymosphaeria variabile]|uniref:RING-type domain-containing protein n=1 Tax=Didymosphaeria variabile TaxID=1932322 RepID=A0A9W8XR79_9PLEO|nr:uncharacterized protein N0V89_003796 [Didymosphaeria variabile]KAJ4355775.1 hypothetical protein N0V89_003796 [Didymosphaeria variabile]
MPNQFDPMNVLGKWIQVKTHFTKLLVDASTNIEVVNTVLAETTESLSPTDMQLLEPLEGYEFRLRPEDDAIYLIIAPQGGWGTGPDERFKVPCGSEELQANYDSFLDWLEAIFDAQADDVEPEANLGATIQSDTLLMNVHVDLTLASEALDGGWWNDAFADNAENEAWARTFVESLEHVEHSEIAADKNLCSFCWLPFGETDEFHPLYEPPALPSDPREAEAILLCQEFPFDVRRPNNDAVVLPCKHIFGRDCLIDSLSADSTCPVCRKEMRT